MTIPGVGIRTAETFVAWVDDIARFRRTRQLGCYFGLVPCQDASANKNRLGHITRDGPPVMRKLITEAAWMAIRGCPAFKRYFEQVQAGKPERKKIALVATAHRLIRVMGARCSEAARRTTETMTAAITTRVLAKATAGAERTPRRSGETRGARPAGTMSQVERQVRADCQWPNLVPRGLTRRSDSSLLRRRLSE